MMRQRDTADIAGSPQPIDSNPQIESLLNDVPGD
jgi:hypothetical protein